MVKDESTATAITVRLPKALVTVLRNASRRDDAPSMTKIVKRGIELALREMRDDERQRR